jgi:hypothetical protein
VVLFPHVSLPLHIFEPRYREMVGDALNGDRTIGVILLQPGYEAEYDRRPRVFSIGCAGAITHSEQLDDGRYNIVLRGLERFHLVSEPNPAKSYRVAQVSGLPETVPDDHRAELRRHRHRLEALLAAAAERTGTRPRFPPPVPDEYLVNGLAQHLELDPLERQALLEREGALARCRGLLELIEMKSLTPRGPWTGAVH